MQLLKTLIHSRHKSPINAFSQLFAGLINYQIKTDKTSLDQLIKLDSYAISWGYIYKICYFNHINHNST